MKLTSPDRLRLDVLVPVVVAIVILAASAAIAIYQRSVADQRLALEAQMAGSNLTATVQTQLNASFKAGKILGERFVESETVDVAAFRTEAAITHDLFSDIQALNWVNPEGVIEIVTPEEGNAGAEGLNLRDVAIPGETLSKAERLGTMQVTPPIELAQGGRGFAAYVPIRATLAGGGFVNIVFRTEPLFNAALNQLAVRSHTIRVTDGNDVVFQSPNFPERSNWEPQVSQIQVGDRQWQVATLPTTESADQAGTWAEELIIAFGLLAAIFASYAIHLAVRRHAAMRASETLLLDIAENVEDAVWVTSADLQEIRYFNPAFERILVRDKSDARDAAGHWTTNLPPKALELARSALKAVSSEKPSDSLARSEPFELPVFQVMGTDGSRRDVYVRMVAMQNANGDIDRVVGLATDVSDLLKMQEDLRESDERLFQAQKLEAVGQLTGGIAHDFNNLLYIIMGNAEFALKLAATPEAREAIDEIIQASRRGADLTKNMLAFAGESRLVPKALDLNEIILAAQSWMTRVLPESVAVRVSLADDLWPILIDRVALESALLNLLLNAKDAMDGRGSLTIGTANVCIDGPGSKQEQEEDDLPPGRYAMVAVSDNGAGIAAEEISRIFEPFYTSKRNGVGTGLGLAMVEGFVKQSGGFLRVVSEVGVGTTFKLYLPISMEEPVSDSESFEAEASPKANARVLLVEDEEKLRRVLARQLYDGGYLVVEAKNGDEALQLYGDGSDYDAVITDIVMPGGLQGPELAAQIRQRKPDESIVFMSGYAGKTHLPDDELRDTDIRLTKPILRSELLNAIKQALVQRA